MLLYRFGGDHLKVDFGYALPEVAEGRLQSSLVDGSAMTALARLVDGELEGAVDLVSAEMAIRALIFHDSSQILLPSCKIQMPGAEGAQPFVMTLSPPNFPPAALESLIQPAQLSVTLGGIDQFVAFPTEEAAQEFLPHYEQHRLKMLAEEEGKRRRLGVPRPAMSLDFRLSPLEFVANNEKEFFDAVFFDSKKLARFLRPISTSGQAAYLGNQQSSKEYELLRNSNAEQFFVPLDKAWEGHMRMLRRALNVPLPLFLTIVLSRAPDRKGILDEILLLRAEFANARTQLWALFDEADFRIFDAAKSAEILREIEKSAADIVPKALRAHEFSLPLRFDLFGRFLELNALGLIKDVKDFIAGELWTRFARIDAANLTQRQLENVELRGLLERFVSDAELSRLTQV